MPMPRDRGKRFLTTGAVARTCGVSVVTVETWIKQHWLDAVRTPGGHFRIPASEFDRFRAQYRFPEDAREPRRILVVDDEPDVVEFVVDCLQTLEGEAKVETAANGYEGLLKVGGFRPELLVLDLFMPKVDGFEVCRRIKGDPELRDIKVLVITGRPDEAVQSQALAAGADDVLWKPFTSDAFAASARRLLIRAGGRRV